MLGIITHFSTCSLRHISESNLELANTASLTSQFALGTPSFPFKAGITGGLSCHLAGPWVMTLMVTLTISTHVSSMLCGICWLVSAF